MKKIFLALMCLTCATMFAAFDNQTILEPLYLSDDADYTTQGYQVPDNIIEDMKAAYGIEEFGRVKGFDIQNAYTFAGEGDRSDLTDGFMFEFVPKGGGAYQHDVFEAYAKVLWDKCLKAADGGELKNGTWDDSKVLTFEKSIKVIDKQQDRKKSAWYYVFQGLKCHVEIIERGYTENGFKVLYVRLERID